MAQTLVRTCLRLAISASQGQGWSEYTNEEWAEPSPDCGTLLITDNYRHQRLVVEDRNDGGLWELATYNQSTHSSASFVDKDISGTGTDISWQRWLGEHVSAADQQHDKIELIEAHVYTRPQDPFNKGKTGYSANGYRTAFELSIQTHTDGDMHNLSATSTDIPENGDITFSGYKIDGRRHQHRLIGTTSEFRSTGICAEYLSKPLPGLTTEKGSDEYTAQLALMSPVFWMAPDDRKCYARVVKTYPAVITMASIATAPTIMAVGGILVTGTALSLNNMTPILTPSGVFTIMFWAKSVYPQLIRNLNGSLSIIVDTSAWTQFGEDVGTWKLLYKTVTLASSGLFYLGVGAGATIFDVRVYSDTVSQSSFLHYYNDVRYNDGKAFLPLY